MAENDVLRHDAGKERYMVELRNVSKIYHTPKGREIRAVDGVTLLVPKGKIFGVIGSSGAGKSTLIRLINVLERPTSGRSSSTAMISSPSPRGSSRGKDARSA